MIPVAAVQAAHAAICEQRLDDCLDPGWRGKCVKAVEAAAPHMLNQAPPVSEGPGEGADAVTGFPRAAYRKRRMA